jgi:hypothetical protein
MDFGNSPLAIERRGSTASIVRLGDDVLFQILARGGEMMSASV